MAKGGYVYIMSNWRNSVLYTGVTSDIGRRVHEHCRGEGGAFTKKYRICKLLYAEWFDSIEDAIEAEKQIKKRSRRYKMELIAESNRELRDLMED